MTGFGGDLTDSGSMKPGGVICVEDNTLTLRDRFAIAALPGLLHCENSAVLAYEYADEMLEARKK